MSCSKARTLHPTANSNVPELPDITAYIHALRERMVGEALLRVRVASPFLLRTFDPPLNATEGQRVLAITRMGKRIVFELENGLFLVLHLMIAGRLQWKEPNAKVPKKLGLCAFDMEQGTLILTEASKERRASLHVIRGERLIQAGLKCST
jgi:formamidopyrimidine-DNA glycosylase